MKQFVFHIALILLGKIEIRQFFLQLWGKSLGRLDTLALVWQLVLKENPEFKPVVGREADGLRSHDHTELKNSDADKNIFGPLVWFFFFFFTPVFKLLIIIGVVVVFNGGGGGGCCCCSSSSSSIHFYCSFICDQKAPFSIATTPRCRRWRYSFPRIVPIYLWYVPYIAEC